MFDSQLYPTHKKEVDYIIFMYFVLVSYHIQSLFLSVDIVDLDELVPIWLFKASDMAEVDFRNSE